jgi:hypothetical protein
MEYYYMSSRKKGQVEFIVIAALVIVAITVIILASRQAIIPSPVTSGLPEEAKTVKDSVTNLIRAGLNEKLLVIYNQGGVLKPGLSVKFGMFDTAVWSACGETSVPDVSKEIGAGVWTYLRDNLKDEMDFSGKSVKFDFSSPRYDVNINKDRIDVRVYLPTKVEDYDIQQPYELSFPSKLYDVLDFSKNFVSDTSRTRFLEMITLTSMMHSNPDSENWVPVMGAQTGCGNVLFKTRSQLLPGIKGISEYTVSHLVWNTQPLRLAENPFYPISNVGGKTYPDLQVAFAYPPSWNSEMDRNFMFSPEPLRVIPKPIMPMIPFCMGPYAVAYSFRYPVVVMVEDAKLNQWFKFAVMVDIQSTQPGNCTANFGNQSEYASTCVSNAKCSARVTVKNTTGAPIEGADASYYICDLGVTDSHGVAEGKIPCMVSELHVYKSGYRSYGDLFRSDEIEDKSVTMEKIADNVTIKFKVLGASASGKIADGKYSSYQINPGPADLMNLGKKFMVFIAFSPSDPNYFTGEDTALVLTNYNETGDLVSEINVSGFQPVAYNVTASISDMTKTDEEMPVGYINTSFELKEGGGLIYVYLPAVLLTDGASIQTPGIDPSETDKIMDALEGKCGWSSAVSDVEQSC